MPKTTVPRSNNTDLTVRQVVDLLLERALERGASDLHLEPRERNVVVRYRIDGLLQEAAKFPLARYEGVARQIKQRGSLDESMELPQNAVADYDSTLGPVTLDIATMPTVGGEKIVIHLKPQISDQATLDNLGFWGDTLRDIEYAVAEPYGMVLSCSPNRTSIAVSLLAMVRSLNSPAYNITTLESPVAQRIEGVTQTDLAPGARTGTYLRAALKQDPNVVMIGNLHDPESADLSVQAALGGRLMLGGVHAGDVGQAVHSLLHLHKEPYMVAAALKVIMCQRFVRRLCLYCRQQYQPNPTERKRLSELLKSTGITTVSQLQELERAAAAHGLGHDEHGRLLPLATTEKRVSHLWKASKHGCQHCHFTGYFGRLGIVEASIVSDRLRKDIAAGASAAKLRTAALKEGMLPLQLDGFIKAMRGLTSMDEVFSLPARRANGKADA